MPHPEASQNGQATKSQHIVNQTRQTIYQNKQHGWDQQLTDLKKNKKINSVKQTGYVAFFLCFMSGLLLVSNFHFLPPSYIHALYYIPVCE